MVGQKRTREKNRNIRVHIKTGATYKLVLFFPSSLKGRLSDWTILGYMCSVVLEMGQLFLWNNGQDEYGQNAHYGQLIRISYS